MTLREARGPTRAVPPAAEESTAAVLVTDVLDHWSHRAPHLPALLHGTDRLSYGQLAGRVLSLARAVAVTTPPGARVAMLSENSTEYVECYYGVPRAGRVLTLLNARLTVSELASLARSAAPAVLVAGAGLAECARAVIAAAGTDTRLVVVAEEEATSGETTYGQLVAEGAGHPEPPRPPDSAPAWLLFTSGTTGNPKGALLTHRNITAGVLNSAVGWGLAEPGALLFPWPMFHVAGYAILVSHLEGSAVHVMRRFEPASFLELVARHSITDITLAPTMLNMLLELPDSAHHDLSSIRTVTYGSAPMPLEILARAMERLPGAAFRTGFGMTELSGLAVSLSPSDHQAAAAGRAHLLVSVGRPMPLARVRVVDAHLEDVAVGMVGEIIVRGDQAVAEYWQGTDHPIDAIQDGWLHTGDLATVDDKGYLFIVDRLKDMIVSGGENVFSLEVEAALTSHPEVSLAAVFGTPDVHWGEVVTAAIRRAPGSTVQEAELVEHVSGLLAGFKRPRRIVFVDELPMNQSGKILKGQLRDTYGKVPRSRES